MLGSKRGAAGRPHIALSAISGGALLWSVAAAAQTASQPESVLITARPPDPVAATAPDAYAPAGNATDRAPQAQECDDFVTAGGWIIDTAGTANGARGNFGASGVVLPVIERTKCHVDRFVIDGSKFQSGGQMDCVETANAVLDRQFTRFDFVD